MKTITLLFFIVFACNVQAQTWNIGGNAVAAPSTFGTTTGFDINFIRGGNPYGFFGSQNMALGQFSLNSVTTGSQICAFGYNSLAANTSGDWNNAFGSQTLSTNTIGIFNNAFGTYSLQANTTGSENSGFGHSSLTNNTVGFNNSGFGYGALASNTSGNFNNAFGAGALQLNVLGSNNNSFGSGTLLMNSSGSSNNAFGYASLNLNTTGSYNCAIGENSLTNNTVGNSNTAIGYYAGSNLTTGSNNIFLGNNAQPNIGVSSSNQLNIGNWIYGYNGNIGIGALNPGNKLEITHGTFGNSGLRFTNLPNSAPSIPNSTDKVLSVNANGDVILVDDQQGAGGLISAAEGLTFDGTNVVLGDDCGNGGGAFTKDREINMSNNNLYFNSSEEGKLYMGSEGCKRLVTRLEIGTKGLYTVNDYDPAASPSGLRFTNLTAKDKPIENKTRGVLSLDYDGDVIWVEDRTGGTSDGNFWDLNGNAIVAGNFLGTTNNMDVVFKRNNVQSGLLGINNTSYGVYALNAGSTGGFNTAVGSSALQANTSGTYNTASGLNALYYNQAGSNNTGDGANTLYNNTSGSANTALGSNALHANTTGTVNTASGASALESNTTGVFNTANGVAALQFNTTGENNVAVGGASLGLNTTGSNNTAVGNLALHDNLTGSTNTAVGNHALYSNQTGNNNTASGYLSLNDNISGNNNAVLGYNTARGITSGSSNTIIGSNIGVSVPLSATLNNTIIIGDGSGNQRIYVDNVGHAGLATTTPTAALHVNCTGIGLTGASNVRFENLQTGSGNVLVIDANGYVKKASATASRMSQEDVDDLRKELNDTKQALEELRMQVNTLLGKNSNSLVADNSTNTLSIIPTPFSNTAKAIYAIEDFKGNATLQILDAKGALIKRFAITEAKGEIELGNLGISSGTVFFNMIVDGRTILSKKSVKL